MAEKKQTRRERIDEAMILNLIGGVDAPPRLVPKQTPAVPPPETPPPESLPPATEVEPLSATVAEHKGKTEKGTGYRNIYLCTRKSSPDTTCRIERDLREKLGLIIRLLGGDDMTVKAYLNNIIATHLEQYRDEINELIRNTKTIKL